MMLQPLPDPTLSQTSNPPSYLSLGQGLFSAFLPDPTLLPPSPGYCYNLHNGNNFVLVPLNGR